MKIELSGVLGKRVPLAVIVALLMNGATLVWWAAAKDRDGFFLEQRVSSLESGMARSMETQNQSLERLARIEERVNAQLAVLDRIERQMNAARK